MLRRLTQLALFGWMLFFASQLTAAKAQEPEPSNEWRQVSPREELRPTFLVRGGEDSSEPRTLIIQHDQRAGLDGWFEQTFEVEGGAYYRFQAKRKLTDVASPERSALVRVVWRSEQNQSVSADIPAEQFEQLGHRPSAEPEHPVDGSTDDSGWTLVEGTYRVPTEASRAIVELHLQWAPAGKVEWRDVSLTQCDPPQPRKVRLASIHHHPVGPTPQANREAYAELIEQAAQQQADLVVLGETPTSVNVKLSPAEVAEAIPGATTEYFAELSKKHQLHIVLSLLEREEHLIYNTAVLLGPEGELIGKYRKVCLPHGEVEKGIAPGEDFPVFDTEFGKVGMMICYDGFFPEVARELSNRGAEVIAWPVWGCNPLLARARACENHVYVVSSTYMEPEDGWMLSAIFDQTGTPIAQATHWDSVVLAEVDLNSPYVGPYNLGDFRSMIPRHRPSSNQKP